MKKTYLITILFIVHFGSPKSFAQPYIGQITAFAGNFAPIGWEFCNGQLLSIAENSTLFTLIGTTYGGDGQTTFALPDYRGRILIGAGAGPGLTTRNIGEQGGTPSTTVTTATLPAHTHAINANTAPGTTSDPTNNVLANTAVLDKEFNTIPNTVMGATGSTGSGQPISNQQPYLGINYIIATQGIFPSHP